MSANVKLFDGVRDQYFRANSLVPNNSWRDMGEAIKESAAGSLDIVDDLTNAGFVRQLDKLSHTVSQYPVKSNFVKAKHVVSPRAVGEADRIEYDEKQVLIPLTYEKVVLDLREEAGTTREDNVASASQSVAEGLASSVFNGTPGLKYRDAVLYGLTTHPNRVKKVMTGSGGWAVRTGSTPVEDVLDVLQELQAKKIKGKFILYTAPNLFAPLNRDYTTNGNGRTLAKRILEIPGILAIKESEHLESDNAVLVHQNRNSIDLAIWKDITIAQNNVGFLTHEFIIYAVMAARIKERFDGSVGVAHFKNTAFA